MSSKHTWETRTPRDAPGPSSARNAASARTSVDFPAPGRPHVVRRHAGAREAVTGTGSAAPTPQSEPAMRDPGAARRSVRRGENERRSRARPRDRRCPRRCAYPCVGQFSRESTPAESRPAFSAVPTFKNRASSGLAALTSAPSPLPGRARRDERDENGCRERALGGEIVRARLRVATRASVLGLLVQIFPRSRADRAPRPPSLTASPPPSLCLFVLPLQPPARDRRRRAPG